MTTDLERRLRALRGELPEPPAGIDLVHGVTTAEATELDVVGVAAGSRRRRTHWAVAALVAAALVTGVVVTVEVVRSGTHTDRRDAVSAPVAERIDPATQVVRDGDRVQASGRVLAVQGDPVRFCAPTAISGVGTDNPDPVDDCPTSIVVTGLDLAALTDRESYPGNARSAAWVTGYAHLVGVLRGDRITEVVQSPFAPPTAQVDLPPPPCAPPAGGWPQVPVDTSIDPEVPAYQEAHPDRIVSIALLRESDTQVVNYVLTVGDPAPVEAALSPAVGPSLCVVKSRYSPAQIAAAVVALDVDGPLWRTAEVYESVGAGSVGADAQPEMRVGLRMVTDAVVALVRGLAPGLVQFDPWLSPVA